jgi:hypothetical protein
LFVLLNRKTDDKKALFGICKKKLTYEVFRENFHQLEVDFKSQNDIHYQSYLYMSSEKKKGRRCSVMFPASEANINLYSSKCVELRETGEDYLNITKPYIEQNGSSVQVISISKNIRETPF